VGSNVWFWHDLWYKDSPLKLCYPTLFSIAQYKEAWAVDHFSIQDRVAQWNVVFTRLEQDWVVEMVLSLYEWPYS
jgi:hypothetical protein